MKGNFRLAKGVLGQGRQNFDPLVSSERCKVIDGGRTKMASLPKDVYFQVKFPIKSCVLKNRINTTFLN